jgi:predicted Zn-dependent peptidase
MTLDPHLGSEVREVVLDQVPLARIYLAHRAPVFGSEGFRAIEVAADLLAAGRASRLYETLVRGRRLAQDVVAFPFPIVGGASIFSLWATARPGVDHEELERTLIEEIDRLASEGPSEVELERVRNLHAAGVASSLERFSERADRISMYTCLFDEPERINDEVAHYEAVTAEDVRAALADVARPDNRLVLTYLPAEAPAATETETDR